MLAVCQNIHYCIRSTIFVFNYTAIADWFIGQLSAIDKFVLDFRSVAPLRN